LTDHNPTNANTEWKDWLAREVLLATAIFVVAVAAQPLVIRLWLPLDTWGLLSCSIGCGFVLERLEYARTRPPLYRDVARILGVIGTLLVILGAFCLGGQLLPGPIFGVVFLVSGIALIAWSNRAFWKPAHQNHPEPPSAGSRKGGETVNEQQ
jgi:peptidoglycan/LPS O-acetylase OafA/YrhL